MKQFVFNSLLFTIISSLFLHADDTPAKVSIPKVLIIGDSISIGYTPHVAKQLKGKATVKHNKGNAQHTGTGLKKIDQWIGNTKWDVIHFNWGLWDICYRNPRSKVDGKLTTSIKQYERNLEALVISLKRTNAKLIWANTTIVPDDEPGRNVGDSKKYNVVATKIMKKHGVTVNDLHALTSEFPADHFVKPGDVHYTKDGYRKIAIEVSDSIVKSLSVSDH